MLRQCGMQSLVVAWWCSDRGTRRREEGVCGGRGARGREGWVCGDGAIGKGGASNVGCTRREKAGRGSGEARGGVGRVTGYGGRKVPDALLRGAVLVKARLINVIERSVNIN